MDFELRAGLCDRRGFGLICVIVVVWTDLCGSHCWTDLCDSQFYCLKFLVCIVVWLTMSGFFPPFSGLSGILSRDWCRESHMTWRVWFLRDFCSN